MKRMLLVALLALAAGPARAGLDWTAGISLSDGDRTFVNLSVGHFVVSVGSARGWRVTGIVGFAGKAIEWANRFHGEAPERIVPEGPLTADGVVRVRFVSSGTK